MNFFRFFFPRFKLIEIAGECNREADLLAFFNGTGKYGFVTEPHLQDLWRKLREAYGAHAAAFASDDVEPLVPISRENLYANGFYGTEERVYALFNANYRSIEGPLIEIPVAEEEEVIDIFTQARCQVERSGGISVVSATVGPRDVTALVVRRK